ncbi:hypothetical protein N0V90_004588 [Kalmusia sp. IMI 367209]|nr:hypothetical protein N0V90_004588 [Kalmusia sp. IMI 367209]
MPTTILITGANRGLGLGLLQRYLLLPNHTVVAAVRSPSHPSSTSLSSLPTGTNTTLIVVKIDASVEADAFAAARELQDKHGITKLDIVIANAGVSYVWPAVKDLKLEDIKGHMEPNVYGMVSLYQATRELLKKSEGEPAFVLMGSMAGLPMPLTDRPKAAAQWMIIRIDAEDAWLNAFSMDPGWVQTDLGQAGAKGLGFESAPTTVDESCAGMMERLAETSKEKHGGKFVHWYGGIDEWKGCDHV